MKHTNPRGLYFGVLCHRPSARLAGCRGAVRWLSTKPHHSFITTPIFYVNAAPHIGHLYSALLADAAHRWRSVKGVDPALFSTGTDEHGLKIQKAASMQNKDPRTLCNEVSRKFKGMFDMAGISYTSYMRTTNAAHIKKVEELWHTLYRNGHIYKGTYSGWYCVSDEAYVSKDQVVESKGAGCKVSAESGHPVEWTEEENYIFRLTSFREQLLDWVCTPPYPIVPEFARKMVVNMFRDDTFCDLSISRPRSRLTWGIPVPNDSSQTIYVWLDALTNYLTVSGHPRPNHVWPPTEHVVGKDILRFHAVFWPAFLLAAGLDLPRRIVTHSHWIVQREKMSKSKGNVVDPLEQFSRFGVEPVRYYLLREGILHHDGDYSMERLVHMVNSDLADTLGNLLLRISSKRLIPGIADSGLQYHQRDMFPLAGCSEELASAKDLELISQLHKLPALVDGYYEEFQYNRGLEEIMHCLHLANQFFQRWEPWHMVKEPQHHRSVKTILLVIMETLRLAACHLYPVTPCHASTLLRQLGFPAPPTKDDLACKLSDDRVTELEEASAALYQAQDIKPLITKIKTPF